MDVLSDVLKAVRLSDSVFFTAEFSAPWALDSPNPKRPGPIGLPEAEHVSFFHILTHGQCLVECGEGPRVALQAGDVIVFPHGHAHTLRSDVRARTTPVDHLVSHPAPAALPRVSVGSGGATTGFICGYLSCSQRFAPLFEPLPAMLVVRRRGGYGVVEGIGRVGARPTKVPRASSRWLATTLTYSVGEVLAARPGNGAMVGRLAELMFVEIVREHIQQLDSRDRGWLTALKDPQVGRAVRLMHEQPMRPWTVDTLAREVAASRSALAHRFTRLLGESPMRYLCGWRMQLARQMLRDRDDKISAIAGRLGYESEPAFNRAFKKATGCPPAAWRRTAARMSAEG